MSKKVYAPLVLEKQCAECIHYPVCGYIHPFNKFIKTVDRELTGQLDPTQIEFYIKGLANVCLKYEIKLEQKKKE